MTTESGVSIVTTTEQHPVTVIESHAVAPQVIVTADATNIVVTTEAGVNVVTTDEQLPVTVIESPAVEPQVIVTACAQGPAGPAGPAGDGGIGGATISNKPKNRLTREADGLYVHDDLSPDPLAYYILAKN